MLRLFVGFVLVTVTVTEKATFDDYKVFRITPTTNRDINFLHRLPEGDNNFSFWKPPSYVNRTVDLMVSPQKLEIFRNLMDRAGMKYETMIENVQNLIQSENPQNLVKQFGWSKYHTLSELYEYLDSLAEDYPDKVKVVIGGQSYENREIKGVKLFSGENRPKVILEAGIHAREWIGPATATYLVNELLNNKNEKIKALVDSFEFHIFPSVNPDGYVYSHEQDRLWRKTRSPNGYGCYGTDPNRNFDFKWREKGSGLNPCYETYAGLKPFSEMETKTFSEYILSEKDRLFAYISLHSYSQLLMFPYGHTTDHLDNYDEQLAIAKEAVNALANRYGTKYKVGNIAETIYPATGNSLDWVKHKLKTPLTFVYELRDKGRHAFLLPAEQIVPNGEEFVDSLVALFGKAKQYGYPKK